MILIVIPGFSNDSFTRNYNTLFKRPEIKLKKSSFEKIILIRFNPQIREFHQKLFKEFEQKYHGFVENKLYKNLSKNIFKNLNKKNYLNSHQNIVIIGKSAGGGVALYLSLLIKEQLNKLFLFAPGIKYIDQDSDIKLDSIKSKITIGWNNEDTKVKYESIKPVLDNFGLQVTKYNQDSTIHDLIDDTQHEINTLFIKLINNTF